MSFLLRDANGVRCELKSGAYATKSCLVDRLIVLPIRWLVGDEWTSRLTKPGETVPTEPAVTEFKGGRRIMGQSSTTLPIWLARVRTSPVVSCTLVDWTLSGVRLSG